MLDEPGCLACDLSRGRRELPGGLIYRTTGWLVEHCIGPLPVGTLVVKPDRHVLHVADLTEDEAAELGPVLHRTSKVATELLNPTQVYVCLWSHGPVHIHFVVQPTDGTGLERSGLRGPGLQAAMFARRKHPDRALVEDFAGRARRLFEAGPPRS